MTAKPASATTPAGTDTPVQDFSHCHEGILAQLGELEQLPALAEAAERARRVGQGSEAFYRDVVLVHHAEEEQELFTAVLASALRGSEEERVRAIVERLTEDHRRIERLWRKIAAGVHDAARGRGAALDTKHLQDFVATYRAHAHYEEQVFLPLASAILGRSGDHMAALGLSLHARRAMPEVLRRFGTYL